MKVTNSELPCFSKIQLTFWTFSISQSFYLRRLSKDWTLLPTLGIKPTQLCPINRASLYLQSGDLCVSQLYCCWNSPAQSFLVSDLNEIYDQDSCSFLEVGPPHLWGEESVFVFRHYICCTLVSAWINPCCHCIHYWLCASFFTAQC